MLQAGPSVQEIGVAQAAVQTAEQMAGYAESRFNLTKSLVEQGVLAKNKIEEIREMVLSANGALVEARARLAAVRSTVRPEQIEATLAQIERLESERSHTQAQIVMLSISTPVSGIVGTPSLQLKQLRRQFVKKGDPIAKVHDPRTTMAEISIPEKDIGEVRVGQPVDLMVRAYPGVVLHGRVTAISAAAVAGTNEQPLLPLGGGSSSKSGTLLVRTQLEDSPLPLKPDMTGQARISCGRRTLAGLLAWRAARVLNTEFWSWL
jgi:multidrug resistance efflux pump